MQFRFVLDLFLDVLGLNWFQSLMLDNVDEAHSCKFGKIGVIGIY